MLPGQGNCLLQGAVEISKKQRWNNDSRGKVQNQIQKNVLYRYFSKIILQKLHGTEPQTPLEEASVSGLIRLNQFRLLHQNHLQNTTEIVDNKATDLSIYADFLSVCRDSRTMLLSVQPVT
jgi:hypothetical protein